MDQSPTTSASAGTASEGPLCDGGAVIAAAHALAYVEAEQSLDPATGESGMLVSEALMAFTTPAAADSWALGHESCVGENWRVGADPVDYVTQTALALPPLVDPATGYLQHYAHEPGGADEHFSGIALVRVEPLVVLALAVSAEGAPDPDDVADVGALAAVAAAKARRVLDVWLFLDGPATGPICHC